MKRLLSVVALAALASVAYAAVDGRWEVNLQRSGANVAPASTGSTQEAAWAHCLARIPLASSTTTQYRCQTPRYVATSSPDPAPTPTCTSPQPAPQARTQACPSGTTGSWTQSAAYVPAAYPTCWSPGSTWLPAQPPAGACTATPPPPPPPPSGQVLFRETFNGGTVPAYGFAGSYPQSNYTITHLANGDADGSGAARLTMRANTSQYGIGWWTRPLNYTPENGVYVQVRLKVDAGSNWNAGGSGQNKFLQIGNTGTSPNSRVIVHFEAPDTNSGCTLAWRGNTGRDNWMPRDFGLTSSTWDGSYGGISAKINVGWDCTPPVALTHAGNTNPVAPGPGSALPIGGWYRLQFFMKPGLGTGELKVWANSRDASKPTRQVSGLSLGKVGWGSAGAIVLGGYWTDPYTRDFSMTLGEFVVSTAFDSTF